MQDNIKEEVFKRLDALAEKLGVAADHLWEVLLRQADVAVYGYAVKIAFVLLFLVAGVFVCRWCFRREIALREAWEAREAREENSRYRPNPDWALPIVVTFPTVVIPIAAILSFAIDALTPLLNPEYWALQKVIEMLGR